MTVLGGIIFKMWIYMWIVFIYPCINKVWHQALLWVSSNMPRHEAATAPCTLQKCKISLNEPSLAKQF